MFGHLIFLCLFIISLTQLINSNYNNLIFKYYVKRNFFPFFTLFLSYQSGYVLFSSYIILFTFILFFLSYKSTLLRRLYKSLYFSLGTFVIISGLSFVVMPALAYHLFIRSVEIAGQSQGWAFAFFNPLLFTGLPFYLSTDQFKNLSPEFQIHIYHYFPLILITILLTCLIYIRFNKFKNTTTNILSINYLISLVLIFIIAIIFYLFIYNIYGNIYQIWKFSAFIILPLSFIPLSLVIYVFNDFCKSKFKLLPNFIILGTVIFFFYQLFNSQFLLKVKDDYYGIFSSNPFLNDIYNLKNEFKNHNFLFHVKNISIYNPIVIIMSKSNNKLFFYPSVSYFPLAKLTFNIFNNNLIFISDINYNGIINSTKNPINFNANFFNIYDYQYLQYKGFVYIKANDRDNYSWQITNYPTNYKFIIPSKLVNKDIIFSLFLAAKQDFSPPCDGIEFGLTGPDGQISWTQKSINDPNFFIPAELTATGQLEVFSRLSFVKGKKCLFNIDSLDLLPYSHSSSID
jgi:hypothetical protein